MDLDTLLRHQIYSHTTRRGKPPTIPELSAATGEAFDRVRDSLARLAAGRIVVLQRESEEILMAPPFSAVPTPFLVETSRHTSYANCAWDAIGVSIMLRAPARIVSSCGCCGRSLTLDVLADRAPTASDVVHFAVPAARWWQDLVYT
jgi:alkylmercury lyase-like protein